MYERRWAAGRTGLYRWCSQCGPGTTPTGMRMQMKTTFLLSLWRRSLLSSWTMWTSWRAPAWGTLCPAGNTSNCKYPQNYCQWANATFMSKSQVWLNTSGKMPYLEPNVSHKLCKKSNFWCMAGYLLNREPPDTPCKLLHINTHLLNSVQVFLKQWNCTFLVCLT